MTDAPDVVRDRAASREPPRNVLVLGGGNALAAYAAGAWEALEAGGFRPDWIVGASAGAITGAILVGNPPERRLRRLREFWAEAAVGSPPAPSPEGKLRQYYNGWHVAWAALAGRPSIFRHRWPGLWSALPGTPDDVAIFDHSPLRGTLERLVDFDLLSGSPTKLTVTCVDAETGAEVLFDNRDGSIGPDHILASAAIAPLFPPVEIDGRLLCDPGYVNNTPLDVAFADEPDRDLACVVVELFGLLAPRPRSLDAAIERSQDLLFASVTRRTVAALKREWALRERLDPSGPSAAIVHLAYEAAAHELAGKTLDFSPSSIADRWAAGRRDGELALRRLAEAPAGPGLRYLPVDPALAAPKASLETRA